MDSRRIQIDGTNRKLLEDFRTLSHRIMAQANLGAARIDFLREVSRIFLEFAECDAVELRTQGRHRWYQCETKRDPELEFKIKVTPNDQTGLPDDSGREETRDLERLCSELVSDRIILSPPYFTDYGSFWTGDTSVPVICKLMSQDVEGSLQLNLSGDCRSIAIILFSIDDNDKGLLLLKSRQRDFFTDDDIEFYQDVALILGVAVAGRRTQVALRERVKELTCLYGIARLVERPDAVLDDIMQGVVELIPPGWLYPEITSGRITLDDRVYRTARFRDGPQKLIAPIYTNGRRRGMLEVIYAEERRELDEGPFLKEERNLIDAIAREIAHIVEHKQAEEEKTRLEDQLRHADRLATIGQLAAGVAHELNEPLGNILGFAQLAQKSSDLPSGAVGDLKKIVDASLHAREIIKKLMVFARQTPPRKTQVNLNAVVEEGLYFFEARCAKAGIELVRSLQPDLPEITADAALLNQVLVNLVVNSIQAMPSGGKLTVQTVGREDSVSLIVEDTGVGMSPEVLPKIFVPFFTTKDVDEGTGLGLAVVHGIVTSHRGSIKVESEQGWGARFEICFPRDGANVAEETSSDGHR